MRTKSLQALGHHIEVRSQTLLRCRPARLADAPRWPSDPLWSRESAGSLQSDRLVPRPRPLSSCFSACSVGIVNPLALLDATAARRASSRGSRSSRHHGCASEHVGLWQQPRISSLTLPPNVRRIEYSCRRERHGLRHLEGEAVAGADAEQVYVGVDSAADPGPRATEEAATGGNAAPAAAAPQVDSGEPEEPADEMAARPPVVSLGRVCVHDTPSLLSV